MENAITTHAAPTIREWIIRRTHGDPPDRGCLPGSDGKWEGYQLAIEDAVAAAEEWVENVVADAIDPSVEPWDDDDYQRPLIDQHHAR